MREEETVSIHLYFHLHVPTQAFEFQKYTVIVQLSRRSSRLPLTLTTMRRAYAKFSKKTSLISLPVNLGQPLLGPDRSPSLLMENGLLSMLGSLGWQVIQVPDIINSTAMTYTDQTSITPKAKNCAQVGQICHKIYEQLAEHAATDNFLLILGGDHCIPIGTIPAIVKHRPSTGVVWVDAHADINSPQTTMSGNMHGMPVSFLLNEVQNVKSLPSMSWFNPPYLKPRDIVYVGLR